MDKGCIHIYTGNGKGKTSAALGIALRAAGAGHKCLLIQFMKDGFPYSEITSLAKLSDHISVERYGNDNHVLEKRQPTDEECEKLSIISGRECCLGRESIVECGFLIFIKSVG